MDIDLQFGKLLRHVGHELDGERLPAPDDEEVVGHALLLKDPQSQLHVVPRQVVGRVGELLVTVEYLSDADERRHRVPPQLRDAFLQLFVHVHFQSANNSLIRNGLHEYNTISWKSNKHVG